MRHAWPLSRNGLPTPGRGVQGGGTSAYRCAGLWPQGPYAPANGRVPAAPGTSSLYGRPASHAAACAGPAYRQPVVSNTQPYPPQQARGPQRNGQQPVVEYPEPPAEELLKERSPELMEKRGDFWKPVGKTATTVPRDKPKTKEKPAARPAVKPRKNHVLRGLLMFLAVAFGVGLLVRSVLFSVRAVQVSGNVNMTQEQVLSVAALLWEKICLELDENEIARRINANHYLSFEKLRLDWPDGVTLFVRERVPCAYANAYGMLYILADDGTVLEDSNDIDVLPDLPWCRVQGRRRGGGQGKLQPDSSEKLGRIHGTDR